MEVQIRALDYQWKQSVAFLKMSSVTEEASEAQLIFTSLLTPAGGFRNYTEL